MQKLFATLKAPTIQVSEDPEGFHDNSVMVVRQAKAFQGRTAGPHFKSTPFRIPVTGFCFVGSTP